METLPTRIGVLVPSLDPVVEHDFQRFLPAAHLVLTHTQMPHDYWCVWETAVGPHG